MKVLIKRNALFEGTEAVILLCCDSPLVGQIIGNPACRIKLQTLHASGEIRIHDRVIDEGPAMKMHSHNGSKLRADASRFPVKSIDAQLEIQSVKKLVIVSVRTDEEFANLESINGCAVVG